MKTLQKLSLPFLILSAFVVLWEVYSRVGGISKTLLPAPSDIFEVIVVNRNILFVHSTQTILEALIGLVIAIILGVGVAVALFLLPRARAGIYPLLVLSQTIPLIALAPLLLIWFGFDIIPKVIIVVLYCFFPIMISVSDALRATDENLVDLLKSMRASLMQIVWYVRLPGALPAFFSGLKIAVTYSVAGAIVGEFVGAYQGLGIFMLTSANSHAVILVFAGMVVTVLATVLLLALVTVLERVLIPWKHYEPR